MHRPSWMFALLLFSHAPGTLGAPAPTAQPEAPERRECERLNDAGSYSAALPHCRQAADTLRALKGTAGGDDGGALGRSLTSLGLALEMTGDRRAAEASYREALARHRAGGQSQLEALVLSNLAALTIGGGDYGAALAWLGEQEAVANRALAAGDRTWAPAELEYVRMNRSVALEQLGAYAEALAEIRPLSTRSPQAGAEREAAALAVNLAVLYRNLGDPRRALTLLERARTVYERLGDRSALANVHLNRALVYQLNLRAPGSAEVELAHALELALASGDRGEEIRTLCALGELRRSGGRLDDARQAFERALQAAVESAATAGRWTARAGLGRVARDAGDSGAALVQLRAAIAEIETTGEGLGDAALRGDLLSDQRAVYATAVDLLAERALGLDAGTTAGEQAARAALALAEQAKARELLDALSARSAGSAGSAGSNTSGAPLDEMALGALSLRLGPTLAYFFGEQQLWRFELDGGRWRVARAGRPGEITELATRIHRALAGAEPALAEDLARLARMLLPASIPAGDELRIVPDGRLFYLPFELLPDPERPDTTLLERTAVSYLPSLAVAAHLRRAPAPALWRVAALADPALAGPLPGGASSLADLLAQRFGLPPLPGAAREARAAAARLGEPSVVDVGGAATEAKLRQRAAEGARVLHIAAHTVVDEALAGGVALFLARGSGPSTSADDGLVTAEELAHLPLAADLAVLSGCRTALAEATLSGSDGAGGGRAIASLSGALLGAGARGVVASLWEVGDQATAALMEQFYFGLARGSRPAIALRSAKLRLAHDPRWAAAPGWAGFVLLGDPEAVTPGFAGWGWLAGALVLVAGGALLLWNTRRRLPAQDLD